MRELTQDEVRAVSGGLSWKAVRHLPSGEAAHLTVDTPAHAGPTPQVPRCFNHCNDMRTKLPPAAYHRARREIGSKPAMRTSM